MADLRVIWGPVWEGVRRVDSGSILVNSGPFLDPYLRNLINNQELTFIWPWVGLKARNMTKSGSWDGWAWVPV